MNDVVAEESLELVLEARIGSGERVALLFTAEWCPAGRILAGGMAERSVDVVDVDQAPALADRYLVVSLPTLVVIRDGRERGRLLGAFSLKEAETLLRRVESESIEVDVPRRKGRA